MTRIPRGVRTLASCLALAVLAIQADSPSVTLPAQGRAADTAGGEWPSYHGGNRNHHYSPLAQITAATSTSSRSPGASRPTTSGTAPEFKLEGTPLMVGGTVYTTAGTRRAVVALDAATGEVRWVHGEPEGAARRRCAASAVGPRPVRTGPTAGRQRR